MAAYYYAAYFSTSLHQSPSPLTAHHPFGITSHISNLPTTPAKTQRQDSLISDTERRILFASGKIHSQSSSPFLRLPAELRNQIYEELLCPSTPNIKDLAVQDHHLDKPPTLYPSILSTCRRIHEEATSLLYTTHIFHAHPSLLSSLPHLASSAKPVLYPAMTGKIRRWQLTLRLDTDPRFTMEQATKAFSGAEYLEIRVWQSMFDGADCSVLKLFLGVRGVQVAKVNGSVEPALARWLEERMMGEGEREIEEDICRCGEEGRVVRCGECRKRVGRIGSGVGSFGMEWFGARSAWHAGNR